MSRQASYTFTVACGGYAVCPEVSTPVMGLDAPSDADREQSTLDSRASNDDAAR